MKLMFYLFSLDQVSPEWYLSPSVSTTSAMSWKAFDPRKRRNPNLVTTSVENPQEAAPAHRCKT